MTTAEGVGTVTAFAIAGLFATLLGYIPRKAPPVQLPPPVPVSSLSPLAKVILDYNQSRPFFALSDSYSIPAKGVIIHKITAAQAQILAGAIAESAAKYGLPISYVLACLAIESCLDPNCVNGNLGPGRSNPTNDPLGYDDGVGQEKLRYLIGYHGILTADEARQFAFDIPKAVDYHCAVMAGDIAWAKQIIAQYPSIGDPRFHDPLVLATGAYNFGKTGILDNYYMKDVFTDGQDGRSNHCQTVINDEAFFAKQIGVTSCFASLAA